MEVFKGIGASPGYMTGVIRFIKKGPGSVEKETDADPAYEVERFRAAKLDAQAQLSGLYAQALGKVGGNGAEIFNMHAMLLEDPDYVEAVEEMILLEGCRAEYAVHETGKSLSSMFASLDDDYMKERSADFLDISDRVVRILQGGPQENAEELPGPVLLAAEDLTPSQTISLDKTVIRAIAIAAGSVNSHSAILARAMGIPAVVALGSGFDMAADGCSAIIDGVEGLVILDPDKAALAQYEEKAVEYQRKQAALECLKDMPSVTRDGRKVEVFANIADISDAGQALEHGAEGVGLFRSEFLYMDRREAPPEEEQFQAYKSVLEKMDGRRVVIRTLDIGADKQTECVPLDKEDNPALGYRAIRICLDREELFFTQVRALLRASVYGRLAVMFPMIATVGEVRRAKAVVERAKLSLQAEGIPYSEEIEWGIMVETPAAMLVADLLAREVDFFSIGTNDLTQYILAADRMNSKLSYLYDPMDTAVLRAICRTIREGHRNGIWVGMCGEAAADPRLTRLLLAMGLDEFSVTPSRLLPLKKAILDADIGKEELPDFLKEFL